MRVGIPASIIVVLVAFGSGFAVALPVPLTPQMFKQTAVGTSDDLAAVRAAVAAAAALPISQRKVYFPALAKGLCYQLSADVELSADNMTIYGDGASSCIQENSNAANIITVTGAVSNISISKLKLQYAKAAVPARLHAGIWLSKVSYGTISDMELSAMLNCGILLTDSSHNTVSRIYTHDFQGSKTASCGDIYIRGVTGGADYNAINDSRILGGPLSNVGIGIQVQRADLGSTSHNAIARTEVGAHAGYGILAGYQGRPGSLADVFTTITGVYVHDIVGDGNAGAATGMCIYSASAGGISISDSKISNCNALTKDGANNPGAISITSDSAQPNWKTLSPARIVNNSVETSHWRGITTNNIRVVITGNTVTNTARDANGQGIRVLDPGDGSVVSQNHVTLGPSDQATALQIQTYSAIATHLTADTNTIVGSGAGSPYGFDLSGTERFKLSGSASDNIIDSKAQGGEAARLRFFSGQFAGNKAVGALVGLTLDNVSDLVGSANSFKGASVANFTASGRMSNVIFDEANDFDAAENPGKIMSAPGIQLRFAGKGH